MNDERLLRTLLGAKPVRRSPAQSRAQPAIQVRDVRSVEEWEDCFRAVPHPHLTQSRAYGEGKCMAGIWQVERLVFEQGSRPVALCQVLQVRIGGLRVAARINRGPLFLDTEPAYEAREGVLRLLRQRWRLGHGGPLFIAPALVESEENHALMRSLGFHMRKKQGWCSALVDLSVSEEEIRKRFAPVWRNRLKAALNSGLVLRAANDEGALEWMLDRHEENMRVKKFAGPRPALLRALHRTSPEQFRVLQAMHEGEAVGGLILAHFGRIAEYYVGWFGDEGRKRNCGNFLYWHALCEAKKAGCDWFDVGGYYSSDKFGHFKQNMRGTEYRLAGEWVGV